MHDNAPVAILCIFQGRLGGASHREGLGLCCRSCLSQLQCAVVDPVGVLGMPGILSEQQGWPTRCGTLKDAMQSLLSQNVCGTRKQAVACIGVCWGFSRGGMHGSPPC